MQSCRLDYCFFDSQQEHIRRHLVWQVLHHLQLMFSVVGSDGRSVRITYIVQFTSVAKFHNLGHAKNRFQTSVELWIMFLYGIICIGNWNPFRWTLRNTHRFYCLCVCILITVINFQGFFLKHNLTNKLTNRENVGLLGSTRVGSRRVIQISAGFMIFFAILGERYKLRKLQLFIRNVLPHEI